MEYISVHEMSNKWNIKERKLTALCREDRIAGARKIGKGWMIPSDALKPLDKRTKEFASLGNGIEYSTNNSEEKVIKAFTNKYGNTPIHTTFTPYRICPLGAHVDHNLGLITGFAIDKGIHIAYNKNTDGIMEIESLQFKKRALWHVNNTPVKALGDWADPLRGATIELNNRYSLKYGINAIIDGELPIGGLSSSSALIITLINALAFVNGIKLTKEELIEIAELAENNYLKIANGKLNQMCEVYSKKNKLLYVDMQDNTFSLVDTPSNMEFVIGIFFSGVDKVNGDNYNIRTDELRAAAYLIKSLSGIEYGRINDTNMRDIKEEVFNKYKDMLPDNYKKRGEHFYSELKRVKKGIKAYQDGDIKLFGKLVTESGESSIRNWETGSKELIDLFNIIKECEGVYGTRFSGSGYKGCCIAFIKPEYFEKIRKEVKDKYLSIYPNMKDKYSDHLCYTADGVKL